MPEISVNVITAEITLREVLSGNKGLLSSPPLLGLCFLFCWQNKPMKFEYFPSDNASEQAQLQRMDDVNPGGRYRQLLYPVMAYTNRS